jgi:hypothetical protein
MVAATEASWAVNSEINPNSYKESQASQRICQILGVNYFESFSPVASFETICTLFALTTRVADTQCILRTKIVLNLKASSWAARASDLSPLCADPKDKDDEELRLRAIGAAESEVVALSAAT